MKTRPIPFTAEMIKAILGGYKTQTRRVIKPQPYPSKMGEGLWSVKTAPSKSAMALINATPEDVKYWVSQWGKYEVGDRLWVQEGYQIKNAGVREYHRSMYGQYLADNEPLIAKLTEKEYEKWAHRKWPFRATSGRFMYHSLSRITLEVERVWVERVQDISEEDAIAEGVVPTGYIAARPHTFVEGPPIEYSNGHFEHTAYRDTFRMLWDSINAKRGYEWKKNNWVWVIEFQKLVPKTLDKSPEEE